MITKIRYRYILLISCSTISLLSFFAYKLGKDFYAPMCVLISTIAALTAATITIKSNKHAFTDTNSLNFQKSLQDDEEYKEAISTVFKIINNRHNTPIHSYMDPRFNGSKERKHIMYVLNTWERAGNAILHGIYNEKYLYEVYKSMVLEIGLQFRTLISTVQTQRNNPDIYKNFTWLTLMWTIRRDSFESEQTKKGLVKVFEDLNRIKSGKIPNYYK
ncbi:prophage membrane protein [Catenovulum agarivorans DS-2]|uniref:Prophage membrane protein n=1 Tax=Catenovulum agarivorans DS-2 TaxID=1328313 RepID=W7QLD2_9ALTE|nr:DUF4760 domain-containing protein [Catenovulum agarivorans]EWH08948.1 prophage membrane protein [Catenovulum agarivorans DS-2]